MLEELTVRNLALSALSEVSFKAGLNCVTGETGAGKSLIVDALSLILGARAETGLIRSGEEKAEVSAWFSLAEESPVNAYLKELDLTGDEDGTLLIRRTLSADGKSVRQTPGTTHPNNRLCARLPAPAGHGGAVSLG